MKSIILAIILIESGFNPKAYNKEGNAKGMMQLTPIGLKEASIQCLLHRNPDLFKPDVNIKYGTCLFDYYRSISDSDVEALAMYHGGYVARAELRKGKLPGPKTTRYIIKVLHYKEKFEHGKINLKYYCHKYNSLPDSICKNYKSGQKETN